MLSVGFRSARFVTGQDLALLETFAELAAVACRNASAATGLALAAHTDGLTGCLNHAALHDGLRREIERCARTGQELSLVLLRPRRLQAGQRGTTATSSATRCCAAPATRCGWRPAPTTSSRATAATSSRSSRSTPTRHAALEIAARAVERMREAIEDLGSQRGDRRRRAVGSVADAERS